MESHSSPPLLIDTTGDFAALRRRGMLYVDKTKAIARLAGYARGTNVFFARPRRFGKSLLVSILAALFRGAEPLFAGDAANATTWIHRHGVWDWSADHRFPVVRLNLNITDVHEAALLREELHFLIRSLCEVHGVPALPDDTRLSPARGLSKLIDNIHTRTRREVVVLIDEYDAPITANLGRPGLEDILDLMRAFYGVAQAVLRADPDALTGAFAACLAGLGYPHHPPADLPGDANDTRGATRRGWASRWDYETHYQALLCNTLRMAGLPPWAEAPTARGRIDAAVDLEDHVCVFEIKLNRSAQEALRQACTGDYPGLFAATRKRVLVIGLNLDTRARTVESCWVQDLGGYRMESARWEREPFALSLREIALAGAEASMDLAFREEGLAKDRDSAGTGA